MAAAARIGRVHKVHLKVDTGMRRMGVSPDEVSTSSTSSSRRRSSRSRASTRTSASPTVRAATIGPSPAPRSSHSVRSSSRSPFAGVTPRLLHAANSAGALGYPEARLSMVRIGLSLYGYLPEAWLAAALEEKGQHLEPALTLRAKVSAVRRVEAGERPSYGRHRALGRRRRSRPSPSVTPTAIRDGSSPRARRCSSTPSATRWPAW